MRKAAMALAAAVAVIGATGVVAPAAQATENETNCWLNVETGESGCYATFADVVDAISGGTVAVASDAKTLTNAQRDAIAASPLATVVIGQVWEDDNYTGSSFSFTASGDCDTNADVDWQVGSMPSGWDNRVTSFKSYGLCATRIWQNNNYTGSSLGFVINSANVGATMNDQTSSIQWN